MWGDFMFLPNHQIYKASNQLENHPSSAVSAAIGLSSNPILNPTFCAALATATASNNLVSNVNALQNSSNLISQNSLINSNHSNLSNSNTALNGITQNCINNTNGSLNTNLFGPNVQQNHHTSSLLPTLQAMSSNLPLSKLYIPQAGCTANFPQLTLAAAAASVSHHTAPPPPPNQTQHQTQSHQSNPPHPLQQLTSANHNQSAQAAAAAAAANILLNSSAANLCQESTANHYHIFVGDIAPEIETSLLREKFSMFGRVTECKIIKDMHTQKPKGYGFVAYATKEEAEDALTKMNGRFIGSRQIRTNWAIRRPPQPPGKDQKPLDYNEVFAASSESNCTIYVGGITTGLTEELLRESFKDFGEILEVRIFKEKGYAFVRFDSHEGATQAIIKMHGRDVGNQPCKCSWGKESNDQKDSCQSSVIGSTNSSTYPFYFNPIGYSPFSLLTQTQFPDLTGAATNYTTALSLQNLTSHDLGINGYMVSPVPNNTNLGAINGLLNQYSTSTRDYNCRYELLN